MSDFPLSVDGVTVSYGSYTALSDVSFNAVRGQILGIAGPNGSGKTTLLRAMFGAQKLAAGKISLQGTPITRMGTSEIGRRISVVAQFENDTDRMRVGDLVLLGRSPHLKDAQGYSKDDYAIAKDSLKQVGMIDSWDRYIDTLSGGERQRVLIARSVAQACPCMLLDEPTNHLDLQYQHQVLPLLRKVAPTAIIILHDLNLVSRYCDEVIILKDGKMACHGKPQATITESMIREIYGVETKEIDDNGTKQFIFRKQDGFSVNLEAAAWGRGCKAEGVPV